MVFKVELDDLYTNALFHVIDVETSNNARLEWSRLVTTKVIALTLYQYLEYTNKNGSENLFM